MKTQDMMKEAYVGEGTMVNSGQFNGISSTVAISKIADYFEARSFGKRAVQYKLRDWLISRQRYWGCPIPIVYCDTCGQVPVPDAALPVLLPQRLADYVPKGKSPLEACGEFAKTTCPRCGRPARRETDGPAYQDPGRRPAFGTATPRHR